jgi:hypothetical protein
MTRLRGAAIETRLSLIVMSKNGFLGVVSIEFQNSLLLASDMRV